MPELTTAISNLEVSWMKIIDLGRRGGPAAEKRAHEFVLAQMARVRGQVDGLQALMTSAKK